MADRLKAVLVTKFTGDACEYVRVTALFNGIGAHINAFHEDDHISKQAI